MRGHPGLGLFVALVGALGAAGVLAGGAPAQGACVVQLRVNVFGSAPPGPRWALQGGLNAGKTATLRATESGCPLGLDHMFGSWESGGVGPLGVHPCAGPVCSWPVVGLTMSAAHFQAYARTASGCRV